MLKRKRILSVILATVLALTATQAIWIHAEGTETLTEQTVDGAKYLTRMNNAVNTLGKDANDRLTISSSTTGTAASAFQLMPTTPYRLSTVHDLSCYFSTTGAATFGLSKTYSLEDLGGTENNANKFELIRIESGNTNALYIKIGSETYEAAVFGGVTRNTMAKLSVAKKNGSWYMTFLGNVIDGTGKSAEVQEALKLENYFGMDFLEADSYVYFFFTAGSLHTSPGVYYKAEKQTAGAATLVTNDVYADFNNPGGGIYAHAATANQDGYYSIRLAANTTAGSQNANAEGSLNFPVTTLDADGNSGEIQFKPLISGSSISTENKWVDLFFSTDPTFADANQTIHFFTARMTNGATHVGSSGGPTYFATNANYYNWKSERSFQIKSDGAGHSYLNIFGGDLAAPGSLVCAGDKADFMKFAGKPIYFKMQIGNIGDAVVTYEIKPTTDPKADIDAFEKALPETNVETAMLKQAMTDFNNFTYKSAISVDGLNRLIAIQNELVAREMAEQKARIKAVEDAITALPAAADLTTDNYASHLTDILAANKLYTALNEEKSLVDATLATKLGDILLKLTQIDSNYAQKLTDAKAFDDSIAALPAADEITLANLAEKKTAVSQARTSYDALDSVTASLVQSSSVTKLTALEARIATLDKAAAVVAAVAALPDADKIAATNEDAVKAARAALTALTESEKALVPADTLTRLSEIEEALANVLAYSKPWFVSDEKITYTGDADKGFTFTNTCDQINGQAYATSTTTNDFTSNFLTWEKMLCSGGQWMFFGLTNDVTTKALDNTSGKAIGFILRPWSGNRLMVSFWDGTENILASSDATSTEDGMLNSFNYDGRHTLGFVKQDGHWYLKIDDHVFTAKTFDALDTYLEANAAKSYVRIGGVNGFGANLVFVSDGKAAADGDWLFSTKVGVGARVDENGVYTVTIPDNALAVCNKPITDLLKSEITVNFNVAHTTAWQPAFWFASSANVEGSKCNKDKVVIRMVNRPVAGDNRTHILVEIEGKTGSVTLAAKEPAILDADSFTITPVEYVDGHIYAQIKWASGTYIVRFGEEEVDQYLRLDHLKGENKAAYFGLGSMGDALNVNVKVGTISSEESSDTSQEQSATDAFLELFEKNIEKIAANDKTAIATVKKAWDALDYFTKNDVEASLMDDDYAYEQLEKVKNFTGSVSDPDEGSQPGDESNADTSDGSIFWPVMMLLTAFGIGVLATTKKNWAKEN